MYPDNFYGNDNFGLWHIADPRVQADCELVLALLRAYHEGRLQGNRAGHAAFSHMFPWAADRCTYDLPEPWSNHDGAKGSPLWHWHTANALARLKDNPKNIRRRNNDPVPHNDFDHAVPQNVIKRELVDLYLNGQLPDWQAVRDYLKPRRAMAVLTTEEHQKLTDVDLRESMPDPNDSSNPFARYEAAGIVLQPPLNRPKPA